MIMLFWWSTKDDFSLVYFRGYYSIGPDKLNNGTLFEVC